MKQFFTRHRHNTILQALKSASVLSLFVYTILRCLFYEFPMTWAEELLFFIKIVAITSFIIATATVGAAWTYKSIMRLMNN